MNLQLLLAALAAGANDPSSDRTPVGPAVPAASNPLARALEVPVEPILGAHEEFALDENALDDSVPLPIAAEYAPSANGPDVLVKPASGDPYFLGFAGGLYFPPKDELVDPLLASKLRADYADGRPTNETYAFVMFQKRMTRARVAALEAAGARVLSFHPHYCLKVALTAPELDAIAGLDFVRWIGVPRGAQKLHPKLAQAISELRSGDLLDVQISTFDSDLNVASTTTPIGAIEAGGPDGVGAAQTKSVDGPVSVRANGWQQRGLEALGVEVGEWEELPRTFRARLHPSQLPLVTDLDFVQFVEPQFTPTLAHDESMPMVNLDRTRYLYDGNTLNEAVVGEADSGIETAHNGFTNFYWWANNLSNSSEATTDDDCGHGSHVAGTILGGGFLEDSYEGAAVGVATSATSRLFITKIFYGSGCWWGNSTMSQILGAMDNSITDGSGNVTPKPHVINHSWGTTGGGYFGTEADCRTIDGNVFGHKQLQVWAAGNEGSSASSLREEASAKNSFTVGSVRDYESGAEEPGTISPSSSRGPCGDGRWKPNVCAPGTSILSVDSGDVNGYTSKSGTSMATPHVTGLAAQLVDHQPFFQYNAASLAATLMATALTKDDQVLTSPSISATHLNTYGTGRIEAYKAHFGGSQLALYYWGWDQGSSNWSEVTFDVNAGATRVVACLTYHEDAASSGASQALVNDFDMWLDAPPLTAGGNTGEYSAQQSTVDNTEIRIVNSPTQGTWKLKVFPDSVTGVAHVGVCVSVIYGDTTPPGDITVTANKTYVQPNVDVDYTAVVANSDYIASGVFLSTFLSSGATLTAATTTLKDGAVTDLLGNQHLGAKVMLGNIKYGETRTAKWKARWATEGWKNFQVIVDSDNMTTTSATAIVGVDGTAPVGPTNVVSTSHTPSVVDCSSQVDVTWTAATDTLSGVDGYIALLDTSPSTIPNGVPNLASSATSFSGTIQPGVYWYYFHIRAVDNAGNPGTTVHLGPFASSGPPFVYCTAKVNSLGCTPAMSYTGQPSTTNPAPFLLKATNVLNKKNGLLFYSTSSGDPAPFQGGWLCMKGPIIRTSVQNSGGSASGSDCSGAFSYDFNALIQSGSDPNLQAGHKVRTQYWSRDPNDPFTTSLTDAVVFYICDF
ncbi:MAG: S8 family serine peptidase [Planctomycetes bacterium]|nr:S8 family serine peptidase [Planctomycetota bacterium]